MVLALAVGWALFPESVVGAVTLLVVGFSWADGRRPWTCRPAPWWRALRDARRPRGGVVASYGPSRLPVDPGVARLWALRGAGVFGAPSWSGLLARAVAELPDSGSVWVFGLVVALSVVVVAARSSRRPTRGRTE